MHVPPPLPESDGAPGKYPGKTMIFLRWVQKKSIFFHVGCILSITLVVAFSANSKVFFLSKGPMDFVKSSNQSTENNRYD